MFARNCARTPCKPTSPTQLGDHATNLLVSSSFNEQKPNKHQLVLRCKCLFSPSRDNDNNKQLLKMYVKHCTTKRLSTSWLKRGRRDGVSLLDPPPIACGKAVRVRLKRILRIFLNFYVPLWGSVAFPNPWTGPPPFRQPLSLSSGLLTFMRHVHHSHTVSSLWPIWASNDCKIENCFFNINYLFCRPSSADLPFKFS